VSPLKLLLDQYTLISDLVSTWWSIVSAGYIRPRFGPFQVCRGKPVNFPVFTVFPWPASQPHRLWWTAEDQRPKVCSGLKNTDHYTRK